MYPCLSQKSVRYLILVCSVKCSISTPLCWHGNIAQVIQLITTHMLRCALLWLLRVAFRISAECFSVVNIMGAGRHGQEGALGPLWKCCKVFLCINSYSKTLSRRIITNYSCIVFTASRLLRGEQPDPHQYSIPSPAGWLSSPDS